MGKRTLSYPREGVTQIIGHTNPATVAGAVPWPPPRPPTARHVKESVSAIFVLQMRKPPTHPVGFSRRIQAKLFPVLQKLVAASWEPQMTEPCWPFSPTPTCHSPAGAAEGALSRGAGSPSGRVRRRGHLESWVPQEGPWHCPPPGGTLSLIFLRLALQQAPPAPPPRLSLGGPQAPPTSLGKFQQQGAGHVLPSQAVSSPVFVLLPETCSVISQQRCPLELEAKDVLEKAVGLPHCFPPHSR